MIYPEYFPTTPGEKTNISEKTVYNILKELSHEYDIFYSRVFHGVNMYERPDYEVDFIIIKPMEAIVLLEVKGGLVEYNGEEHAWYQSGRKMDKAPTDQVISCVNSLLKRYPDYLNKIPVTWAVCFPQCEIDGSSDLPTSIDRSSIIDQKDLLNMAKALNTKTANARLQFNNKTGLKDYEYTRFKGQLLRGLGFVTRLSTRIAHDEKMYIRFTEEQYRIYRQVADNDKLVVNGPAGSGKTILAKEIAKDSAEQGKRVLLLCFNRTLAYTISDQFKGLYEKGIIEVSTFHHFARMQVDDEEWFKQSVKDEEFWSLLVPEKLEAKNEDELQKYDTIIVDEGQDFREFWFELVERHLEPGGKFIVFLDANQDIFNHYTRLPGEQSFTRFKLTRNCRNSRKILKYLTEETGITVESFDEMPSGDIITRTYKNDIDQVKQLRDDVLQLVEQDGLEPGQLVILIHSDKRSSCVSDVKKLGKYELKSIYRPKDLRDNQVRYATIDIFKGLESDVVFLCDMDKMNDEEKLRRIYVEASRAKHRLYVYEKEPVKG